MLHYDPTVSIITGIAWDHVNIYKTYDSYKDAFRNFLKKMGSESVCFFDQTDEDLLHLMMNEEFPGLRHGYQSFDTNKTGQIVLEKESYPIEIFGEHNMKNLHAAFLVCKKLGIEKEDFFKSIASFKGAAKRLEKIYTSDKITVYKDFAHAPSKCKATVAAIKSKFPNKRIKAILELHTFSSLDAKFLPQYQGAMDGLEKAAVFFDPHAIKMKKMPTLEKSVVLKCFGNENLEVINETEKCHQFLEETQNDESEILLIMSSGNLGGFDLDAFLNKLRKHK